MQTRNRWQTWSAGFALVLAGCGQAEAPKEPSGAAPAAATSSVPQAAAPAVVESAATKDQAAEQPAAQPVSPASLEEATRAIHLRKFPLPDGGKDLYKSTAVGEPRSGKDLNKSARALSYVLRRSGGAQVA